LFCGFIIYNLLTGKISDMDVLLDVAGDGYTRTGLPAKNRSLRMRISVFRVFFSIALIRAYAKYL